MQTVASQLSHAEVTELVAERARRMSRVDGDGSIRDFVRRVCVVVFCVMVTIAAGCTQDGAGDTTAAAAVHGLYSTMDSIDVSGHRRNRS